MLVILLRKSTLERKLDVIQIRDRAHIRQGPMDGRDGHVGYLRHVGRIHRAYAMDDEAVPGA